MTCSVLLSCTFPGYGIDRSGTGGQGGTSDACSSHPCSNNGRCIAVTGSFVCLCAPGFRGDTCDVNFDDCSPDPCRNGGKCIDGNDASYCECTADWIGTICETRVSDYAQPAGGSVGDAGSGSGPGIGGSATSGGAGQGGSAESHDLPQGSGTIAYVQWADVPGSSLADFPWDEPASLKSEITSFEAPLAQLANQAAWLGGLLTAPLDGEYRFWIACDDNCELWISPDQDSARAKRAAFVIGIDRYTDQRQWNKFPSQQTTAITLEAGRRYRIEAFVKQSDGGTNLAVAWLKPGESGSLPSEVISGRQLSPLSDW